MSPQLAEARCAALANENSQLREALRRLGPSKAADDGEAVAVVPAVETSPGVAQAQPRLEVHEAHVEVHALAHRGAALLCEEDKDLRDLSERVTLMCNQLHVFDYDN